MRTENRSERWSLEEGATDGKYRKVRPDTQVVEPEHGHRAMMTDRAGLHPSYGYDYIAGEAQERVDPTARVFR